MPVVGRAGGGRAVVGRACGGRDIVGRASGGRAGAACRVRGRVVGKRAAVMIVSVEAVSSLAGADVVVVGVLSAATAVLRHTLVIYRAVVVRLLVLVRFTGVLGLVVPMVMVPFVFKLVLAMMLLLDVNVVDDRVVDGCVDGGRLVGHVGHVGGRAVGLCLPRRLLCQWWSCR